MIGEAINYTNAIAPVRTFTVKAVFSNTEPAFTGTFTQADRIQSYDVQRVGEESKFFGFGIVQRLNLKLRDNLEELDIPAGCEITLSVKCGSDATIIYPSFYVSRVNRDENTGQLSITAYDILYHAKDVLYARRENPSNSSVGDRLIDCCHVLRNNYTTSWNGGRRYLVEDITQFTTPKGWSPNLDGTETVKDILDAVAEYTQTVYYMSGTSNNALIFKRLDRDGDPVLTISKSDYFTLKSGNNRRLQTVAHITELGDNVAASTTKIGTTQYIRDNPWFENDPTIEDTLQYAIDTIGNITINQFDCYWRGFPALEIGDKIALETKTGEMVYSYILNDTIEYNGSFSQKTSWKYEEGESNDSTPHTIGEVIREVYAKVDRVNKEISLVVSEKVKEQIENGTFDTNIEAKVDEKLSQIQIDTESIKSSVMESTQEIIDQELIEIKKQVSQNMTKDEVEILIQESTTAGATSVETTTGYTFNQDGLNITKTGSPMNTTITEDGMTVYRDSDPVLIANNEGVKAEDLHATTYLIIGLNSRFEDYDDGKRTGCFWIGD